MPAGPDVMGFAYFLAAKLVGYSAFCHWVVSPRIRISAAEVRDENASTSILGAALAETPLQTSPAPIGIPSSVKAGVIRTLIGIGVGAVVGLGFWSIPSLRNFDFATPVFFAFLVPVRVGEWAVLLRWVYRIHPFADSGGMKLITFGILASFALDALGIAAAWVLPGGMWVC